VTELTVDTIAPLATAIISIPENATAPGINAAEAADGTVVNVNLLGTNAVAGDTLTVNWGAQTTNLVLTAANIASTTAAVTVPSATITTQGNGTFNVTARVTDQAQNAGALSPAASVSVDITAPVAPTALAFASDSGTAGDGITNDTSLTISGTAEALSTVTVFDGATNLGTTAATAGGVFSFVDVRVLADASSHSYTATATDAFSNTGAASSALSVAIDTSAPAAPVITGFATDTGTVGDGITSDTSLTISGTAENNSTVNVFDGATNLGTATASGTGAWSFIDVRTLANASAHTYTATATDAAANTGVASAVLNVAIDTAAPAAPVITGFATDSGTLGDGLTNDTSLTVSGTAEANSTVTVFDGATSLGTATATGAGAWSFSDGRTLANAQVVAYTAYATDAAGNVGGLSTALNVTIDTVAPTSPGITGITSDTGPSGTDGITSDTSLTVSGTAEANSTVSVSDGATVLGTATASGAGAWSFVDARTLGNGATPSYRATATDAAGNTSAVSSFFDVFVDIAAPSVTATTIGRTNDNTPTLLGTVSDGGSGIAGVSVTVGGQTFAATVTAGTWSATVPAALADGTYNVTAVATDNAGNTATDGTSNEVIVDATSPTITITSGGLTGDNTPVLSGTASDNDGIATVTVTVNGTTYNAVVSGGSWSATATTVLPDNVLPGLGYTITATATDLSGTSANATLVNGVTVDSTIPTVSVNAQITNDNTPTITGTVGDGTGSGIASVTVVVGSQTLTATVTAGTWTVNVPTALADGVYNVQATATDVALNTATDSLSNELLIDTVSPSVTVNQAAGQADPTRDSPVNFTVIFSEAVTGFTAGGVTLVSVGLTGTPIATVTGSGTTYNVSVAGMTGTGTVSAFVAANAGIDAASNNSLASTSTDNTVTYDDVAPSVTIEQAAGQGDPTNGSTINFTVTFSEVVTGFISSDVQAVSTGAGTIVATVSGSGAVYNVAVTGMTGSGVVTASFPGGVAVDAAGNISSGSTSTDNAVTFDNIGPTVTVDQASGQADPTTGSTINFTAVFNEAPSGFTSSDIVLGGTAGATTAVVSGSGTTFNVAVTGMTTNGTVTATIGAGAVTDALGNVGSASTSTDNSVTLNVTQASSRFFRMYNAAKDFFFFTASLGEFNALKTIGLRDEATGQPGFGISPTQVPGTLSIHRFFIPSTGDHYYTIDQGVELATLNANPQVFTPEGTAGFLWSTQVPGTTPIFQLYNKVSNTHLYTSDVAEKNFILATFPTVWEANTNFGFGAPQSAGTFVTGGATQVPARSASVRGSSQITTVGGGFSEVFSPANSSFGSDLNSGLAGRMGSVGTEGSLLTTVRGSLAVADETNRVTVGAEPADRLDHSAVDNFWETVSGGQASFWDNLN
jgi:hypothetical protein